MMSRLMSFALIGLGGSTHLLEYSTSFQLGTFGPSSCKTSCSLPTLPFIHQTVFFYDARSLSAPKTATKTVLSASLKPAALPLMDSGKALARSGELVIDTTTALDIYGGGLSAAGAQLRNCGDAIAQAAASCRFKTGSELVCDELREGADCLKESADKLQLAIQEAQVDDMSELAALLESALDPVRSCSRSLEAAGAAILQGLPVTAVGQHLMHAGESLSALAGIVSRLSSDAPAAQESGQRMLVAADKMVQAGKHLRGAATNAPGKSWLKGGRSG